jgi:hypothetical protein
LLVTTGLKTAYLLLTGSERASTWAVVAQAVATVILVFVTWVMAYWSAENVEASKRMAERMADGLRPVLIPEGGIRPGDEPGRLPPEKLYILSKSSRSASEGEEFLKVRNIGNGPAINVAVRVKFGENTQIGEGEAATEPIPSGETRPVRQWKQGTDFELIPGSKVIIHYSDILGRYWLTETKWENADWQTVDIRQVEDPPAARKYPPSLI